MPARVMAKALLGLFFASLLAQALVAQAQVQRSFTNPSFESPSMGGAAFTFPTSMDGWQNSPAGSIFEVWTTGLVNDIPARSGSQLIELESDSSRPTVFQGLCIASGETVNWKISHRGRGGVDIFQAFLGDTVASMSSSVVATTVLTGGIMRAATGDSASSTSIQTCHNGSSLTGTTSCAATVVNGWADYSGTFTWNGASGVKFLGLTSVSTARGVGQGNVLDDIQFNLKPFVELGTVAGANTTSGSESISSPLIGIRPVGIFSTTATIAVTVSGGSAVLGIDFNTPSGSTTFNVSIPPGNFSGSTLIPFGVTIINDSQRETDETIVFSINPSISSDPFIVAATSVCGASANTTATYTITDNDTAAAPTVAKAFSPASVLAGIDSLLTIVLSNSNGITATTVNLTDTYPAGLVNSPAPSVSNGCGGTVTAAAGAGSVSLNGASIPAAVGATTGTCSISLNVRSSTAGSFTNTIAIGGLTTANVGNNTVAASRTLTVTPASALSVSKSNAVSSVRAGETITYTLSASNLGPSPANNALLRDPAVTGLNCSAVSCTSAIGTTCAAAVPAASVTIANLQGSGIPITSFPPNTSLTFNLTCSVSATGQ
jgi:uncharacterized repeat protein (TIGR01451 family)